MDKRENYQQNRMSLNDKERILWKKASLCESWACAAGHEHPLKVYLACGWVI